MPLNEERRAKIGKTLNRLRCLIEDHDNFNRETAQNRHELVDQSDKILKVYTDGSCNRMCLGSAALVLRTPLFPPSYKQLSIRRHSDNMQESAIAEIYAIILGLELIVQMEAFKIRGLKKAVIFSDGAGALNHFKEFYSPHAEWIHKFGERALDGLKKLKVDVRILWVKGHSKLQGNELADKLAYEAAHCMEVRQVYNARRIQGHVNQTMRSLQSDDTALDFYLPKGRRSAYIGDLASLSAGRNKEVFLNPVPPARRQRKEEVRMRIISLMNNLSKVKEKTNEMLLQRRIPARLPQSSANLLGRTYAQEVRNKLGSLHNPIALDELSEPVEPGSAAAPIEIIDDDKNEKKAENAEKDGDDDRAWVDVEEPDEEELPQMNRQTFPDSVGAWMDRFIAGSSMA